MRLLVLRPIKLKRAGRVFDVSPGGIVEVNDPRKAQGLIDAGYIKPLPPPDESGETQAVRIWSSVLQDEVWVVTHPDAVAYVPEGAVIYHPEEIRNFKGASEEEVYVVHRVKKELGGQLIMVKERKAKA